MKIVTVSLLLIGTAAFADSGTIVYTAGNVAYVFPWRLCLMVSAALSFALWAFRK